jgi:hypothetical protein
VSQTRSVSVLSNSPHWYTAPTMAPPPTTKATVAPTMKSCTRRNATPMRAMNSPSSVVRLSSGSSAAAMAMANRLIGRT